MISEETGTTLKNWLETGVAPWRYGAEQRDLLKQMAETAKIDGRAVLNLAGKRLEELREDEFNALLEAIKKHMPPEPGSFDDFPGGPIE